MSTTAVADHVEQLRAVIAAQATPDALHWLDEARLSLKSAEAIERLAVHSAVARRRMGTVRLQSAGAIALGPGVPSLEIRGWEIGDAARVVLALELCLAQPENSAVIASGQFRVGDESERAALVGALSLFPEPRRLKPVALEAGRINSLRLFSALALDNPYPCQFYEEHEFNQLVLKALFAGLGIERLVGLRERSNPELSRMCESYVRERLDADRSVPVDIWLALAPHCTAQGNALLLRYLGDGDPRHRYYAALAMAPRTEQYPEFGRALFDQAARETDERVRDTLNELVGQHACLVG